MGGGEVVESWGEGLLQELRRRSGCCVPVRRN